MNSFGFIFSLSANSRTIKRQSWQIMVRMHCVFKLVHTWNSLLLWASSFTLSHPCLDSLYQRNTCTQLKESPSYTSSILPYVSKPESPNFAQNLIATRCFKLHNSIFVTSTTNTLLLPFLWRAPLTRFFKTWHSWQTNGHMEMVNTSTNRTGMPN